MVRMVRMVRSLADRTFQPSVELRLGDLPLLGVRHGAEELVELLQEEARHLLLVRPGEVPGEVRGEDREGRKGFEPMFFITPS